MKKLFGIILITFISFILEGCFAIRGVDSDEVSLSFSGASGTSGVINNAMIVMPSTLASGGGSTITNCTVSPPLPAWATINPTTCAISGTPTTVLPATTFTIVPTNSAGQSTEASVTLTVAPTVPSLSFAGATGTSGVYGTLMTVTPTTLTNNGAAITNCTVSPALPAWATINPTTCVISGTPTGSLDSTIYSITATNAAGTSSSANVTLVVGVVTAAIQALMQGTHYGCVPSSLYPGYYSKITAITINNSFIFSQELSASSTCATNYYKHTRTYEIAKAEYKTVGDPNTIILTLKQKEVKYVFNHPYYVGLNYCGYTNWALGVEKILTGVTCVNMISTFDTFHTAFRALDEIEYQEINLTNTSITIPEGYVTSGDTFNTRRILPAITTPRI